MVIALSRFAVEEVGLGWETEVPVSDSGAKAQCCHLCSSWDPLLLCPVQMVPLELGVQKHRRGYDRGYRVQRRRHKLFRSI